MTIRRQMEEKLIRDLAPTRLEVIDESHHHIGHAGSRPDGESHFQIQIVSPAFTGKSRIERHRMVNAVLAEELKERVHAMALTTLTPEEDAAR